MAQTAYPIIRQYDPNATIVLFGGLHLYSGTELNLTLDKDFAGQLAAKNIQQFGDAISVHAYTCNKPTLADVQRNYNESLAYYRGLFNNSLQVWVTEIGKPLEEIGGEDTQIRYLNDSLSYFNATTARMFWFSLLDNGGGESSFGLIGNGVTPRRAYYELQGRCR